MINVHTLLLLTLQNKWTPLHLAVQNGHISVVEILIRLKADVNAVEKVNIILILFNCLTFIL